MTGRSQCFSFVRVINKVERYSQNFLTFGIR